MKIVLAFTAIAVLVSSCGTTEQPPGDTGSEEAGHAGPVTVTDSRGEEVELPEPAEDVVALEYVFAEHLVNLEVMPVGVVDVEEYSTWVSAAPLDDSVENVGTRQEPSVDSIVALEPDLVIVPEERGQALINQIEEYFPVLVMTSSDASDNIGHMKESFTTIAETVGKEERAEESLADFDTALADAERKLAEAGVTDQQAAMAYGWQESGSVSIQMYGKGSLASDLMEEIGLRNAWTGEADPVWGLQQTDAEGLVELPNVHFFYLASGPRNVFTDVLPDNAIWQSLPFVENHRVHQLDKGTQTYGGTASCEDLVDQIVTGLTS